MASYKMRVRIAASTVSAVALVASGQPAHAQVCTISGTAPGPPACVIDGGSGAIDALPVGPVSHAGGDGIVAETASGATGEIVVEAGAVTGSDRGIRAVNRGTGGVAVRTTDGVTGSTGDGLYVVVQEASATGDLSVTVQGVFGGQAGITARNGGTGAVSVTAVGTVFGGALDGLTAFISGVGSAADVTVSTQDVVVGALHGIVARNDGTGAVSVTSLKDVTGSGANGIDAYQGRASGTGDVSVATSGTIVGGQFGIVANNAGTGSVSVVADGDVTGSGDDGINAFKGNAAGTGDVSVRTSGTVVGRGNGILAGQEGGGSVLVTATADVTGWDDNGVDVFSENAAGTGDVSVETSGTVVGDRSGILAGSKGTGAVSVVSTGDVTGSAVDGITVYQTNIGETGGVTVETSGTVVGGRSGIAVSSEGAGAVSVVASRDVTGSAQDGILAYRGNAAGRGDLSVEASGTIVGGQNGIWAGNLGTGSVTVVAAGDVTGSGDDGISALQLNTAATGDVVVQTSGSVVGRRNGILAGSEGTGGVRVTASEDVTGLNTDGISAFQLNTAATGDVVVQTSGTLTGNRYGLLAGNDGNGSVSVTSEGDVAGATSSGVFAYIFNALGSGDITIGTRQVTGGVEGIHATTAGDGSISVTSGGAVTGTLGTGVAAYRSSTVGGGTVRIDAQRVTGANWGLFAENRGAGDIDVSTSGEVEGRAFDGIGAYQIEASSTGDVGIDAQGPVAGNRAGIQAFQEGTGAISVTARAAVSGAGEDGISATSTNTSATGDVVVDAQAVDGAIDGIRADTAGAGSVVVTASGDVTGAAGSAIRAVRTTSAGGGAIRVDARSLIGSDRGLFAENLGAGDIALSTGAAVEGRGSDGIGAFIVDAGSTGDIAIDARGPVTGHTVGVRAQNDGTGAISVITRGAVTGAAADGIQALGTQSAATGDVRVVTRSVVTGAGLGIHARTEGGGTVSVTASGKVTGASDDGIRAESTGTGSVAVTAGALVRGLGGDGIEARVSHSASAGQVRVHARSGVTGAATGILARTAGTGAISLTATGNVTGSTQDGIDAVIGNAGATGALTIDAGRVDGARNGILARNEGTGAVSVTARRAVSGAAGDGISATLRGEGATADVAVAATTVRGGTTGLSARNEGTGAVSVRATGPIEGAGGDGVSALQRSAGRSGDVTVALEAVAGASDGIEAGAFGGGSVSVLATGDVLGRGSSGIRAYRLSGTGDGTVRIDAGTVTGRSTGLVAENRGAGRIDILARGDVTAATRDGIGADQRGARSMGDVSIASRGRVTGARSGIRAQHEGGGAVSVTAAGPVTGSTRDGIEATLIAPGGSGALTVEAGPVTGAHTGIRATSAGTGAVTVTAGRVIGRDGTGILAALTGARSTAAVEVSATTVTGGTTGIHARNDGTGPLAVSALGDVTGVAGDGVRLSGVGRATLDIAGAISGGRHAIALTAPDDAGSVAPFALMLERDAVLRAGTGWGLVNAAEDAGGAAADPTVARDLTVDLAGTVVGGDAGAIAFGAGDDRLVLRDTARIRGAVDGGADRDTLELAFGTDRAFALDRVGAGRQFRAFERLSTSGSGKVTLTGRPEGVPLIVIGGAGAVVNEDIAELSFDVRRTAVLSGAGTIGSLRIGPAARLAPGNSIGTLNVKGDAAFARHSIYRVEVAPDGSSDRIVVDGRTRIDGGVVRASLTGPRRSFGHEVRTTIVEGSGARTGRFDAVTVGSPLVRPSLAYPDNDVVLVLEFVPDFERFATDPNGIEVARALESFDFGRDMVLGDAFVSVGRTALSRALDVAGGELHAATLHGVGRGAEAFVDLLQRRGSRGRFANGRASSPGAGPDAERTTAWIERWGREGRIDPDGNAFVVHHGDHGVAAGVEVTGAGSLTPRIGGGLGLSRGRIEVVGLPQTSRTESVHLGVHMALGAAGGTPGLSAGGALSLSHHDIASTRRIEIGRLSRTAVAAYGGRTLAGELEVRYGLPLGASTPDAADTTALASLFAGVRVARSHIDGFAETGAALLDLSSASSRVTRTGLSVGGTIETRFDAPDGRAVQSSLSIAYDRSLGDTVTSADLVFAGSPGPLTVRGPRDGRDRVRLSAAAVSDLKRNVRIRVSGGLVQSRNRTDGEAAIGLDFVF